MKKCFIDKFFEAFRFLKEFLLQKTLTVFNYISVSRFDILVNGGGSVTLEFTRLPFITKKISVLVPWNQVVTMESVVMHLTSQLSNTFIPDPKLCGVIHDYYNLKPVVLSTWQHTQLGACPEKSTLIPESQVYKRS